ncbi:MAG: family 10 glycosylhydrolase [Candidatus Heimdallarchaeota archaeon]
MSPQKVPSVIARIQGLIIVLILLQSLLPLLGSSQYTSQLKAFTHASFKSQSVSPTAPSWLKNARIVGYEFWEDEDDASVRAKVAELCEQNVNVLELDIGLINNYETFFEPEIFLNATKQIVSIAHEKGLAVVEYIAGFELITPNVAWKEHSTFKDHPDWIQRDLHGNYAVYGPELGFWVEEGAESAWVTPLAPEWRSQYMSIIADLAATGVDGIYIDVPFWRTWYSEENDWTWGSFDNYTVSEFISRYGHPPPANESDFDLNNPLFIEWLQFRTTIINEFFAEVSTIAKGINPNIQIIAEIWLAQALHALLSGADPYYLYDYVDAITYEFGTEGDSKAFTEELWLYVVIKNLLYRALDHDHPSWILDYAVKPEDSTLLAAADVLFEGNFWETKGPEMAGTVGFEYRKGLFNWIATYDDFLYGNWEVVNPVAVYYSPQTRDFVYSLEAIHHPILDYGEGVLDEQFWGAYNEFIGGHHSYDLYGLTAMLLQSHIPTKIITSRDLARLQELGVQMLILPDVAAMNETEMTFVEAFAKGKPVIATGNTSLYYQNGTRRAEFGLASLFGISIHETAPVVVHGNVTFIRGRPGEAFFVDLLLGLTEAAKDKRTSFFSDIFTPLGFPFQMLTNAPTTVFMNPYTNGTTTIVRAVNFDSTRKNHQKPNEQTFNLTVFDSSGTKLETNSSISINYGGIVIFNGEFLQLLTEFYIPRSTPSWLLVGFTITCASIVVILVLVFIVHRKRLKKN